MTQLKESAQKSFKKSIISPEEVSTDGWYTFNLNPSEQYEFEGSPISRWNKCYQNIQGLISRFVDCATIEGNLEISRSGRVHMHGYIKYKKIADFYLILPMVSRFAHIEIDTIDDINIWDKYVTKSEDVLKNYQVKIKQDKLILPKNQFLKSIQELSV